jgi:hypothetical protein
MTSPFALARTTEKTGRLPVRGREPTTEQDLSNLRSDEVAAQLVKTAPNPGLFADAATAGLQRPLAGASAAISPWMHPGTSFAERYEGGKTAYADRLRQAEEDAGPMSALAQQVAGGAVMGGPTGSILKQGLFDAGTGAVQAWAGDDSWSDILKAALFNAGTGGVMNAGGAGKGALDARDEMVQELLKLYRGGQ